MIDSEFKSIERIVRTIPVGFGGYIIGKKGLFKTYLLNEFGARLRLNNDPNNHMMQIINIDCPKDQRSKVEQTIDEKISQIGSNKITTITSNPNQLKPLIQLGKLIPGYVMNMSFNNDMIVILETPNSAHVYDKMNKMINTEYCATSPKIPSPIGVGCICIVLGSRGKYYRGLVLSYYYDLAHIYFVDIGKVELLPASRLFKIKVKFLDTPFRAVPVKWNNAQLDCKVPNIEEMIYRRFLCGSDSRPKKVYLYFTHVNCCLPNVNLYIPKPSINEGANGDFVDLLELLSAMGLGDALQSEIVLSQSCRRITCTPSDGLYYKPCNFAFYEHLLQFKSESRHTDDHNDCA